MTSQNLENLVTAGSLKRERGDQNEFDGLVRSARARLTDAFSQSLSSESKFDLAYSAAHAASLAALRWHGYRPDRRYIVFQCLPHTIGVGSDIWRVLDLAHERRNKAEYEGARNIDETLIADLLKAAKVVLDQVAGLGPVPSN